MDPNYRHVGNFDLTVSQIGGGQPCRGRMTVDRHENTPKSNLFALVPLYVCIRSYFYVVDVFLSTLLILVAIVIYGNRNETSVGPDGSLRC